MFEAKAAGCVSRACILVYLMSLQKKHAALFDINFPLPHSVICLSYYFLSKICLEFFLPERERGGEEGGGGGGGGGGDTPHPCQLLI